MFVIMKKDDRIRWVVEGPALRGPNLASLAQIYTYPQELQLKHFGTAEEGWEFINDNVTICGTTSVVCESVVLADGVNNGIIFEPVPVVRLVPA